MILVCSIKPPVEANPLLLNFPFTGLYINLEEVCNVSYPEELNDQEF